MDLQTYIRQQAITKEPEKTKLYLLKSVSELLLMPEKGNLKPVIKYLSVLANTYHIGLKVSLKRKKVKDIDKILLNQTSQIIKNDNGYMQVLPETFNLIMNFARNKDISLDF